MSDVPAPAVAPFRFAGILERYMAEVTAAPDASERRARAVDACVTLVNMWQSQFVQGGGDDERVIQMTLTWLAAFPEYKEAVPDLLDIFRQKVERAPAGVLATWLRGPQGCALCEPAQLQRADVEAAFVASMMRACAVSDDAALAVLLDAAPTIWKTAANVVLAEAARSGQPCIGVVVKRMRRESAPKFSYERLDYVMNNVYLTNQDTIDFIRSNMDFIIGRKKRRNNISRVKRT